MKPMSSSFLIGLVVAAIAVAGCGASPGVAGEVEPAITIKEQQDGISVLTLSEHAAERLSIVTAQVQDRGAQKIVPYAAVIYDAQGATWTYTVTSTLTYRRAPITVDEIAGDEAILSGGPDAGTEVVIVGAAELYGAETGVGGGH